MRKWRSGSAKTFYARPIKKIEYPILIKAMIEDGLHAEITDKGIVWYLGDYEIYNRSVREIWGLSIHQFRSFQSHIYEKNPFGGYYEGNNYING